MSAKAIAQHFGVSHDAIRTRFRRLRPGLRRRLLSPLEQKLQPIEWSVVESCLIDQLQPKDAADIIGCTVDELATLYASLVEDEIRTVLGADGIEVLVTLLGKTRPK